MNTQYNKPDASVQAAVTTVIMTIIVYLVPNAPTISD
jgi:hypothetical protein